MSALFGEVGLGELAGKFRGAAAYAESPEFLREIADVIKEDVAEGFYSSTAPDGTPWQAPVYRAGPPLMDTQALFRAATGQGAGHYEFLGFRSIVLGVDGSVVPYAATHQHGATPSRPERTRDKPWVFTGRDGTKVFTRKIRAYSFTIPARPFYGFGARLALKVSAAMMRSFRRVLGG